MTNEAGSKLIALTNGMALDPLDIPLFQVLKDTVALNEGVKQALDVRIEEIRRQISASIVAPFDTIHKFVAEIDNEIGDRLAAHSLPFWLTLFRSILAINDLSERAEPESLVRDGRLVELCIGRYARYSLDDIDCIGDLWSIIPDPSDAESILHVSRLARIGSICRVDLRRIAFGAKIELTENGWETVMETPELQALMQRHNVRSSLWLNAFRGAGIPFGGALPPGRGYWWITLVGKNEGGYLWSGALKSEAVAIGELASPPDYVGALDSYVPAFGLRDFNVDGFAAWLGLIREDIQSTCGFPPEAVLLVLRTISDFGREAYLTFRVGHRLRSFGFMMCSAEDIWSRIAAAGQDEGIPIVELEKALASLTRTSSDAAQIDSSKISDARPIVRIDDRLVLDFNVVVSGLRALGDVMGAASGNAGNVRGHAFEDFLARIICETIPEARIWRQSRTVAFDDESELEVDVGVVIANALVICECKANRQGGRSIFTPGAVSERWARLRGALMNNDERVRKLTERRIRDNGAALPRVARLLSCVVTTSVEWIADAGNSFWFTDEIPRICTAGELLRVLSMIRDGGAVAGEIHTA